MTFRRRIYYRAPSWGEIPSYKRDDQARDPALNARDREAAAAKRKRRGVKRASDHVRTAVGRGERVRDPIAVEVGSP